jgi:hypothetical protein
MTETETYKNILQITLTFCFYFLFFMTDGLRPEDDEETRTLIAYGERRSKKRGTEENILQLNVLRNSILVFSDLQCSLATNNR